VIVLPTIAALNVSPVLTPYVAPFRLSNVVKLPNGPFHLTTFMYEPLSFLSPTLISYSFALCADRLARNKSSDSWKHAPPAVMGVPILTVACADCEGGIISTTQDLAKWEAAISTGKLLKPSSLGQMWTASRLNSGKPAVIGDNGAGKPNYYGLGWYISEHRGHSVVFHPGDKPGFSSTITRFEGDHLTVIILCNTSTESPVFPLSLGVADFYLRSPGRVPK
jgi:hypothetical protein